jgi:hypothetical protein
MEMRKYREQKEPGCELSTARVGVLLFLSLLIAYLITASGRIDTGDGQTLFDVSQSLLEDGDVTIAPPDPDLIAYDLRARPLGKAADLGIEDGYSVRGRNGNYYSLYGIGHSLLILPLLALGRLVAPAIPFATRQWTMQFVTSLFFNPLVSASSGLLIYLTGRRLTFAPMTSVGLAIIYAFATMTWVYSKTFFSEPLITLLLLLTFYSLLSYRYTQRQAWLWVGGASLGFAVLTKPVALIYAPVLTAYLIFVVKPEPRWSFLGRLLAFGIPLMIGMAVMLAYNWWRFESPLDTGYRTPRWMVSPFLTALYGILASPGRGYLLYNPISIAAAAGLFFFWRRHKAETVALVGIVLTNLLFFATFERWHGGGGWGPRHLLLITPFLILPLGSLLESVRPKNKVLNLLLATLIALSVIVQIPGVFVNFARHLQEVHALSVDQYFQRVTFEVAYSPLIGHWGEMREVVGNLRDPVRRAEVRQVALQGDEHELDVRTMDLLSINLPDFWFVYLIFFYNSS